MQAEKKELRRYLLGQLDEADQERLELRLLTDPVFVEEFDTIVDEIIDQYVAGELDPTERERVEQYFLTASERRDKVNFASVLRNYTSDSRRSEGESTAPVLVEQPPGLREKLLAFWGNLGLGSRVATAMATVLVTAGIAFLLIPDSPRSLTTTSIELTISQGARGDGPPSPRVKLLPDTDALRIRLRLPEGLPEAKTYRVESLDETQTPKELKIEKQDEQSITVLTPVAELTTGRYAIQVTAINPDGTDRRIPGTYRFELEAADSGG